MQTHLDCDEMRTLADNLAAKSVDRTDDSATHDLSLLWRDLGGSD